MAHHGKLPFGAYDGETADKMRKITEHLKSVLGPTKEFPQGKLTEDDEGEIAFAVGVRKGKVVLDFGGPVAWIGMDPNQAAALANTILAHARKARIIGQKPADVRHKANVYYTVSPAR